MKTNLEDLSRTAFDEWQSDMPLEYQMPYVPLYGVGFKHGMLAAISMPRSVAEFIAAQKGDE